MYDVVKTRTNVAKFKYLLCEIVLLLKLLKDDEFYDAFFLFKRNFVEISYFLNNT